MLLIMHGMGVWYVFVFPFGLIAGFSLSQLNSVFEFKPPISRAKMANITKLAMKSVKVSILCYESAITFNCNCCSSFQYYKHIVMIVEKFISKVGQSHSP